MKKYINPEMIFNAIECGDVVAVSIEKTEFVGGSGIGNEPLDIGDFLN